VEAVKHKTMTEMAKGGGSADIEMSPFRYEGTDSVLLSGDEEVQEPDFELMAEQLPIPQGYKMLVAMIETGDRFDTEGDAVIYKVQQTVDDERTMTVVAHVLEMGSDCYLDTNKFPTGPWCQKGDYVTIRRYAGTRLTVQGKAFRIINDDTVECTVVDPRGIRGG
jgi:co-chaperonin GroES (HSP10)